MFCKRLYIEGYLDNNDFLESALWALHGNHVKTRDDFSSNIKGGQANSKIKFSPYLMNIRQST